MQQLTAVALAKKQTNPTAPIGNLVAQSDMQMTREALQHLNLQELAELRRAIQRELFMLTYFPKIVYGLFFFSMVLAICYFQYG